ncbi:MAG: hypothetical protein CMH49_09015 [Myxococcales bacterium]|nr:hypothetical protein [Myxococcales bacterium]
MDKLSQSSVNRVSLERNDQPKSSRLNQVELEAILAESIDLLRRNLNPKARAQLKTAIDEYEKYYPHLVEAKIALCFNYFLACLDQHDAPDYQKVLRDLIQLFKELPSPTTTSREVSHQLSLLIHNSSLHIEEELREELGYLVARDFEPPQDLKDPRFILEAHISPTTIAQLSPIDSGLLCYTLSKQSLNIIALPSWMRKIYRSHIKTPSIPPDIEESLTLFTNFHHQQAYDDAYQELLKAFEWAVYCAPIFAFEWVFGLISLEEHTIVENLAYLYTPPLERRVVLTIKMHRDFAALLADERDAERLALHHWQEVISLSQHHLQEIARRQTERATHHNKDLETQGWLKVRIAEGLIAQGDDLQAQKILESVASKARIDTLHDPVLSASALSLSGMLNERFGHFDKASTDYYNALNRSIPRPILSHDDVAYLEWWAIEQHGHQKLTLITIGIKRSCDLIRLTNHPEALADLDLLTLLLSNLSHSLPYEPYLETVIYLGLTYAHLDEIEGAKRSLEAAQALDHTTGIALSNLFILKNQKRELSLNSEQPAQLRPHFERVLKEVEGARGGEVQRQLQLHSTLLFLQANLPQYHTMSGEKRLALGDKIESLLKKTYESFCQRTLRSHLCQFSLLLPKISEEELEGQVKALLNFPECQAAARWLVKIIQEQDHPYYFVTPKRELSRVIQSEHSQRFKTKWITREEVPVSSYQLYNQLAARRDTPSWPQRALNAQEARLEFYVFEDWLFSYLVTKSQQVITHQIRYPKVELEYDVNELLRYLLSSNEPNYLFEEVAQKLYQILLEPFAKELDSLHRLLINPNDILSLIPFSALVDSNGRYLGEKLEIAITLSTAAPVFMNHSSRQGKSLIHQVSIGDEQGQILNQALEQTLANTDPSVLNLYSPLQWSDKYMHLEEYDEDLNTPSIVIFEGELGDSGTLDFLLNAHDEKQPLQKIQLSMSESVRALVYANANSCILTRNISPYIIPQRSIKTLLTSLHGGLIHCRWQGQYFDLMMERMVSRLNEGSLLIGMMGCLTHIRRLAIQERQHPREWAGFELYIAEHQLR